MTTTALAICADELGGKFIDGVKGAAAGMAIGGAIKWIVDQMPSPSGWEVCEGDSCRAVTRGEYRENVQNVVADIGMHRVETPSGQIIMVSESEYRDINMYGYERAASLPSKCSYTASCIDAFDKILSTDPDAAERSRSGKIIPKSGSSALLEAGGSLLKKSAIAEICLKQNIQACTGKGKAWTP